MHDTLISMSKKHSIAAIKRWSKISKEERTKRMRKIAIIKQQSMTVSQRRKHALIMVKARDSL